MKYATKEFLEEIDALTENRKKEIRNAPDNIEIKGTTYYVSNDGDDNNDGLTPETAWKTLEKVSDFEYKPGDGVRLKRGDIFRGWINAKEGVTYCAYGEGDKPELRSWKKNLADSSLWELHDAEHNIWHMKEKILDVGALVLSGHDVPCYRHAPSYVNGKFVCRYDEDTEFVMSEQLGDLECVSFFTEKMTTAPTRRGDVIIADFPVPDIDGCFAYGDLYFRCDKGNPGEVFDSIEAIARLIGINFFDHNYVTIDNICLKYYGCHAIAGGACKSVKGIHVSNCEIGFTGGSIHNYFGNDPNYPQGGRGTVGRLGNGVEIYGGCDDYVVENCYIYQAYDCAITHQITTFGKHYELKNILYKDNVIERCVYGIEYFLEMNCGDTESFMENVEMCGNIIRNGGYGWGQQRHNKHTPSLIKGWSFYNRGFNQTIHHNIFDRSAYRLIHTVARKEEYCPRLYENTYIQNEGGMLGQWGGNEEKEPDVIMFSDKVDEVIKNELGDRNAKVYIVINR